MLTDHRIRQEHRAAERRKRKEMPRYFGEFLADLAIWDWFICITFRDNWRNAHRPPHRPSPRSGPPCPSEALSYLLEWLADIERGAGHPIGWIIAEEFGRLGGRFHCHLLVSGVALLRRDFWWHEAYRRFGRTTLESFDREGYGAFYAAKYEAKQLGTIHFGGTLAGKRLSDLEIPSSSGGKQVVISSAQLPKTYFRLGLGRWHR
jgi:hypothetical protein